MDTVTERDGLWTVEHEPVGLWKRFRITVCGGKYKEQGVASPDGLVSDGDILTDQPHSAIRLSALGERFGETQPAGAET